MRFRDLISSYLAVITRFSFAFIFTISVPVIVYDDVIPHLTSVTGGGMNFAGRVITLNILCLLFVTNSGAFSCEYTSSLLRDLYEYLLTWVTEEGNVLRG